MATLLSNMSKDAESLPHKYIVPPSERPAGDFVASISDDIPVIDLSRGLGQDRAKTVQKILKASREFGFFQVINHGVPAGLVGETTEVVSEFFGLPAEVKASSFTVDSSKRCRLYTSTLDYATAEFHYWRDNLTHPVEQEDCMQLMPQKPIRYREVVGASSMEVRKMVMRVLDMICEGLGLEEGYFGELSKIQLLSASHYPKCPEPSLALGMLRHCDPNLITVLDQGGVHGLQFFKDHQWIGVDLIPNAFVLLIGCQLQIISNDRVRSTEHRVVTNSEKARTSVGYFFLPSKECKIGPAKALVNDSNPPLYKDFHYAEFLSTIPAKSVKIDAIMECFKLRESL